MLSARFLGPAKLNTSSQKTRFCIDGEDWMNRPFDVLNNKYLVISVMGPHASESEREIFGRKIEDITRIGKTFWLNRSQKARPDMVQRLCKEANKAEEDCYCIFIEPSAKGGASPATTDTSAKSYSEDGTVWYDLPSKLSPVTGKIGSGAQALVFDQLQLANAMCIANLWDYADFMCQSLPLKIIRGVSTVCAVKKDMHSHKGKMISNRRRIVAIGRICDPSCVYLK
jgi:hypothetical protein